MKRTSCTWAIWPLVGLALLGLPVAAWAEFVPGRLYIGEQQNDLYGLPDRIWELDPQTGNSRLFWVGTKWGPWGLYDIQFRPDGQALRANHIGGRIHEIYPDGSGSDEIYGRGDGLRSPYALTYDRPGNFYVMDGGPYYIWRFPGDRRPPAVTCSPKTDPVVMRV
jgi:hypothetical protein